MFWYPQFKRYEIILKNMRQGVVLDMGGTEGELHNYLLKNSKSKIFSVDFQQNPDIKQDLNGFPYKIKGDYADTIVAGEVIEHLEKPLEFLKECNRILKKGGRLILTTPNMIGLQHFTSNDGKWLDRKDPHINAWNIAMLGYLVEKGGFKTINKQRLNAYWNRNILFRLVCFLVPKIRPTLFFVAEKSA